MGISESFPMSKQIYLFSISSHPNATHINPLEIHFFKPTIDFSKYDYFIITSKQIAKILSFYEISKEKLLPALCISKQSAKSYEAIGGKVLEIGKGYGDTLVEKIKEYPKTKKWLYLRAEIVASNFVEVCKNDGYDIDESIIYESKCSDSMAKYSFEDDAVLIFTSPSSVECFLRYHHFSSQHKIVVIGKTTLKKIPKEFHPILSKETSIESCMQIAQSL
jgi:uroporphyrinogen-III synthase